MDTTRLLLPFTSGVDIKHINHALYLAKASGVALVTLSLIPVRGQGPEAGASPERVQAAKDFQEAFRARAELYQVPVEQRECTGGDMLACIFSTAGQMNCQSILLVFDNDRPCFLLPEESGQIRLTSSLPLYILQMPTGRRSATLATFKHAFSLLKAPLSRVS